jgi:biotin carboxyl carrier protein
MVVGGFGPLGIPPGRIHDWILSTTVDEGDSAMAEEIRAEMVANVWKVVASAGDEVAEGDTLVILESMKMEIPVLAESDGTVSQLAVNEGDVVQEGDLIAVIDD